MRGFIIGVFFLIYSAIALPSIHTQDESDTSEMHSSAITYSENQSTHSTLLDHLIPLFMPILNILKPFLGHLLEPLLHPVIESLKDVSHWSHESAVATNANGDEYNAFETLKHKLTAQWDHLSSHNELY